MNRSLGHSSADSPGQRQLPRYAVSVALAMILALAALLRLWRLGAAGYGSQYYAAGVLSMLDSWHNFFFNSFDPAGFVSVDKPPLALWLQAASAKVFGFSAWSVLLPQALEGTAAVALLYHLVQRCCGRGAALLAALFLALTPVSVAIDRSNNTDSCLVLALLAAAWVASLAAESGSWRLLLACMAVLGVAFNVKMLAAIVILPPLVAVYLLGAAAPMRRKLAQLVPAAAVLLIVSLFWCVAYDLTPAASRPYAGSTQTNSMLELVIGENGVRRFVRNARIGVPASSGPSSPPAAASQPAPGSQPTAAGAANGNRGQGRGADRVPIGPLRLANPMLADQMGWLYPLALFAAVAGLWRRRPLPLGPQDSALLLWAGWVLVYGLVLSFAGGIFHAYYLAAMAPPVCALAALGVTRLWNGYRAGGRRALALPCGLLIVVAWEAYISYGYQASQLVNLQGVAGPPVQALRAVQNALLAASAGAVLLAAGVLLLAWKWPRPLQAWSRPALWLGVVALLLTPAAWSLGSARRTGAANSPAAQPLSFAPDNPARGRRPNTDADPRLLAFLAAHDHGQRFLLATPSSQQAAPIILATGKAVLAMGGFAGSDPILTPASLGRMVEAGQLRFALVTEADPGGFALRAQSVLAVQAPLRDWIREHGTVVDPALWRSAQVTQRRTTFRAFRARNPRARRFNADTELFDLRPDTPPEGDSPATELQP
jgi:4-amino-4-deoxy-L-arabinose transferase-like glycosyltransferase